MNRYGGRIKNDLNMVLNHIGEDDPIDLISYPESKYVDIDGLKYYLTSNNDFTILSINIQSINAKYNELLILMNELTSAGHTLDALYIQETWLSDNDDTSPFRINNFNLIPQGKQVTAHGGLAIYLHEKYKHIPVNLNLAFTSWEYQCIEVFGGDLKNKITICNIYRPSKESDCNRIYKIFLKEFTEIMVQLSQIKHDCAVLGDFNIDLLKINKNKTFSDFFDMIVGFSFIP